MSEPGDETAQPARVDALIAAGDLRAAAEMLARPDPERAAGLFRTLLDHGRAADCLYAAGRGVEALEAALRAADSNRVGAIHRALLSGRLEGLERAEALYASRGREDLAAEAARALGRPVDAAAHFEAGGDGLAAGLAWIEAGQPARAIPCLERALPEAAEALARLYLRLQRPREALRALASAPPGSLHVLTFLRLGLVHAAREVEPGLGDPLLARARLEQALHAGPDPDFLGLVRIEGPEPGGAGLGFLGEADGEPVLVRMLNDAASFARVMTVYAPALPGVPKLVSSDSELKQVVVARRGLTLDRWLPGADAARARRVLEQVAETLEAAHRRGIVHGRLARSDVRVLPGLLTSVDGWFRRYQASAALTVVADEAALVAPEVQLGQAPTPAADVYAVARLAELLFEGVSAGALSEARPELRPSMEALRAWLGALKPEVLARPGAQARTPAGAARGDVLRGRLTERVSCPEGADLKRLRALAAAGLSTLQAVLGFDGREVVLEALDETPATPSELSAAAFERDLERVWAAGVYLGAGPSDLRRTAAGARVRIAGLLFDDIGDERADQTLLDLARQSL